MSDTRSRMRKLLNGPEMVIAPFVYDCLQAKLAQHAGFKAIYMTGFGTAAARGFPDLGLHLLDADSQTGLVQGPGVESAMLSDHRHG